AISLTGGATIAQPVNFTNTGLVKLGDLPTDAFVFDGGLTHTTGPSELGGKLSTNNQKITLGALAVSDSSQIDAGSEAITLGDVLARWGTTLRLGAGNSGPIQTGSFARNGSSVTPVHLTFDTSGAVVVSGAIGQGVGTVTVTQADSAVFQGAIGYNGSTPSPVSSLVLTSASTAMSFLADLAVTSLTTGAGAFDLSFTGSKVAVTNGVTLLNTGAVTLGDSATDSLAFTGGLVATASSGIQLGGSLATTNSALKLAPVTLLASSSLATGTGAITLAQLTGTGSENVAINATGALTVSGPTSKVNALTLVNTGGATFTGALDASSLAIQDTTGKISLPAGATLGSLTTAAKAYSLDITGITVTAPVSLLNTGSVAMSGALAFDGGLKATAASSITLAGVSLAAQGTGVLNLATTNPLSVSGTSQIGGTSTGAITLPAVNLADGASLILGAGASTPITTGAISGTAGGSTSAIAFDTSGAVSVNGAVGTDLGSVTLTNTGPATFASTLTAGTVTSVSATGTVTVAGNLTTTGNLDAQQANYALRLQGASNTIGGKLLLANQGTSYLGTSGTAKTLATAGISAQPGNTVTAIGTLATAGTAASLEALSLAGNTLVDTTNGGAFPSGAPITFASVQSNGYLLTLNAGTGGKTVITDITLSGVFSSASPIEFAGKLTLAGNATLLAPAISFTSSGSVAGNSKSLAVTTDNFAFASGGTLADLSLLAVTSKTAGVAMGLGDKSGAPILLSDAFLAAADATAGVALLRIGSGTGNGTISVSTADGQVEINTATKLYGSGSTTILSSDIIVTGDFLLDDALQVNAGNHAIEATGNLTVTGGTAGIYATKGQTNNLAMKAGTALVTASTAGFGSATGSLLQGVTLEGGSVTLGPVASKVAGNLAAISSAGPLTFSGSVETGGSVSVQSDSPISLKAITTGNVAGVGISQTGAGAVTLADNLTTTGGSITFDSAITLSTPAAGALVSITTTANGNVGAAISLQAVTASANDLRLDSGKGSILVAGTVSGIDELQLQSAATISTGSVTFQANLSANSLTTYAQPYAISLLGDTVIQQAATLANTGMATLGDGTDDDLTFTGGLTHLAGSTTIGGNLATSNQAITLATTSVLQSIQITSGTAAATFSALTLADGTNVSLTSGAASFTTIDSATGGSGSLAIKASGTVQATGGIGSTTPLGTLAVQSATGATFQGAVKAGTLDIQNKVTGTIRVDGAITLDTLLASAGAYNLSPLGGGAISNDVAFLNTGTLTLNGSATNTLALGGTATATSQSSRTLAGTITSVGAMTLGPVTLAAATSLTGSGGLAVGTVTSAGNSLRVESGSGNPLTLGAMANLAGGLTLANSGAAASLGSLGAATSGAITLLDSQGLVTFTGSVNATTLTITDSQAGVTFAGPVTTSGKSTITDTADGKLVSFASTLNAGSLQAGTSGKADGFALSLLGNTVVTGTTTAYNTGTLNLGGNAATTLNLQGGLAHGTGPTTLGGILTTSGAAVSLADLTLTANSTIRTQVSGLPGANLTLSGALDGGSYNLSIDLGTLGSLNATGAVDKLGTLTLTNAAQASFLGAFGQTAPGIAVVVSALAPGGTVGFLADTTLVSLTNNAPGSNWCFAGDATTITQPLALSTTGSVQLGDGGSLVTLTGGATVLADAGITVNGQVQTSGNNPLTLGDATRALKVQGTSVLGGTTTGAISLGDLTLADKATLTLQGTSSANLRSVSGATGATATALSSTLTGALTVSGPVNGLSALTLNQGAGATFLGAVGTTGPGSLTIGTSVTGTVLFSGPTA
ncbi:MAG: beta strand repeat-containing protein, partial [Gemmataceae bacterium]